jgi:hypothetical protein
MLMVATSLTAWTAYRLDKHPVELRQELGHELGPFGRGCDRVAKEVTAAGQQRADRRGVVALEHQGLEIGQGHPLVGYLDRCRCRGCPGSKMGRRIEELGLELVDRRLQAVGLGAGAKAEPAGGALV